MAKALSDLNHTSTTLRNGGEIIVLDTGAVINAEAEAMLQALHSRSTGGLRSHLETLEERGAEDFIKNFYVGYGHKSIGDCGTTTVFIEGVSMLAAKAVQQNPLYSGQEASTRYIDFSKQPFIDPTQIQEGHDVLEMQRRFYMDAQEPTRTHLRNLNPQNKGEKDLVYEKAINARAFDVTRSLLPAGASTNFAWHTNLRQAADVTLFLRHHPLSEVREIGEGLEEALQKHHPNSFGHKRYFETEAYQDLIAGEYFYHNVNSPEEPVIDFGGLKIDSSTESRYRELLAKHFSEGSASFEEVATYFHLFVRRPSKTELPKYLAQLGTMDVSFQLDFGSFRDIQRHRAITQRMPLLTSELGFNKWYSENLPIEIRERLPEHLENINSGISELGVSREEAQYFLPMGYNTSNRFTGDLPATIYMVELRDSRFVHPTLQKVAHSIGEQIKDTLGIPLHVDPEPGRFDIKRGEQDITLR
jgi:thymidylate synthase ThyX